MVVTQAFKSPAASKQAGTETAMGLHALAVEAALANFNDKARYETAAPHIKALLEGKHARFQALGHLFQGAIDLEKAGMVVDAQAGDVPRAEQVRLRSSALGHLKTAATQLPHLAEAQARYGVALILNSEPAMGRQYLQLAQRIGNLEPQYLIWAAWSVVQAGYPEDAEPIVARMIEDIKQGRLPRSLEGTLHLLSGEIHQARRSPTDLRKAVEEYGRAFANGQDATPAVELRLAQIEVMLGRPADALKRIDWLVSKGKAGAAAENLAVLTLQELKRDDDARKRLAEARVKYPESSELAVLEATILTKAKKPEEADRLLSDFLAKVPDNVQVVQMRAQILAQDLDRPAEARKLLAAVAERGDNSAPLVQLALLEIAAKDYDAVAATIAKIRARWKDAATGDLLDAQLALAKNDLPAASGFFDSALKKDPSNKLVRFWKAQLDGQADPEGASKVFEMLAHGDSVKEVENGLSLVAASQTALAGIAMETGDLDSAIARYREMLKDPSSVGLSRTIRWQLVAAQVAKKEWASAKAEINALLNDPRSPATPEERVRAATFYRLNKEDGPALALSDEVLKADPGYPGAVVTRAEILARTKKHPEAIATIRKAIDASTAGGKKAPDVLYLMMAAVESTIPPTTEGFQRALVVLDQGLVLTPDSVELTQAKCKVLTITQGPKAGAAFVEEKAKASPKGPFRRMLLNVHANQGDFAAAEKVAADLLKDDPADASAATLQVRMIAGQSVEAARRGDRPEVKRLDEKAAALIYGYRGRFKADPTFTQLECELELRRGDTTRALALTQEIDAQAKGSPVGPLLRAQIFASKGQPREAADAFAEALARNPAGWPRGPAPARPAQPPERPDRRRAPPVQVPARRRPRQSHGHGRPARRGPGDGLAARQPGAGPGQPGPGRREARRLDQGPTRLRRRLLPDGRRPYAERRPGQGRLRPQGRPQGQPRRRERPDDGRPDPGRAEGQGPAGLQGRPRPGGRPGEILDRIGREGRPDTRGFHRLLPGRPDRPGDPMGREGRRQARIDRRPAQPRRPPAHTVRGPG